MNRPYTVEQFRQRVAHIRSVIPDISISTDIIVGFSTETETAFENTVTFAQDIGFSFIHVFPYSVRKMTKAAALPQLNSEQVKKERVHRISAISNALQQQRFQRLMGQVVEVVIEHHDAHGYHGYSSAYDAVCLPTENQLHGIIQAVVCGVDGDTLIAKPL
jgi:threonylcarbamoyladenosine tRNA methylthiotransferase MtaB